MYTIPTRPEALLAALLLLPILALAQGPTAAAPAPPARAAEDVISLFSDAYDDTAVDTYRTDWSNGNLTDTTVAGNATLRYTQLGFVGIELIGNPRDLSGMTHLHYDIWTPNVTSFRTKIVDFGGDGFMGDNPDTEAEISRSPAQGEWVSVDIPLSEFLAANADLNLTDFNQFVISADPFESATVWLDNVYFYAGEGGGGGGNPGAPMAAAPAPEQSPAKVISLFSDAYENVPVNTFGAPWSEAQFVDTSIAGNATLLYRDLNFAGIEFLGENALDLAAARKTHLHFDYWSANATEFRIKLVDFGGDGFMGDNVDTEAEVIRTLPAGSWQRVEIPLTEFVAVNPELNQTDVSQLVIVAQPAGEADVFLDNLFFYQEQTGEVTQINLPITFEDPNVDYGLADFGGNASELVTDPTDEDNTVARSTKTAGAMVWAGTTLTSTTGGAPGLATPVPFSTEATVISVRVWSPAAGVPVRLKAEQTDDPTVTVETEDTTTVAMGWQTLEFDFANEVEGTAALDLDQVYGKLSIFFNFGTMPTADETYFWDDLIFTNTGGTGGGGGGGGPAEPTAAAPTPDLAADVVISLFSDAYDDRPVDTWNTVWSQAALEDITVAGDSVKKYTQLVFNGIELIANPVDVTGAGMTHLRLDYWTPNLTAFRVKLVDFNGDGFMGDAGDSEAEVQFTTEQGQWVTLDIPLTEFTQNGGMPALTDLNQIVISGDPGGPLATVYLDNVFFYNMDLVSTREPEVGLVGVLPNPALDRAVLTAPARMDEVRLFAASGQLVAHYRPASERFELSLDGLAPGPYFVLVRSGERLLTARVIKR